MRAFKQLMGSASILYYIHIHYYTFLFFGILTSLYYI